MIVERIEETLPGAILERHDFRGDQTVLVANADLLKVVDRIHEEGFQLLVDLTATDWPEREDRFEVVYHWLNLTTQERLRLKLRVKEGEKVASLAMKFRTADWYEREVFDMFGVPFAGHPNLKRLLTWDDFQGHALRKDFPLDGGDAFCTSDIGADYNNGSRAGN